MRIFKTAAIGTGLLLASLTASFAASPNGTWLRSETGGQFRVGNCGGGLGISVTKSKTASFVGQTIMCGAQKVEGKDEWRGSVKNLEDGNTYSGVVTLTGPNSLQLKGCALAGLICKAQNWSRVK